MSPDEPTCEASDDDVKRLLRIDAQLDDLPDGLTVVPTDEEDDETTCEGSVGPLNDKTCEACGSKYGTEEPPRHPSLCPFCATVIDRDTKARKEEEPFNWFE